MPRTRLTALAPACGGAALAFLANPSAAAAATGDEPAGGAAAAEALGATAGAVVVTALLAVLVAGHRSGRISWLAKAERIAARQTGLPGWAALPSAVLGISLLIAVLGMYWDVSLHIDNGRDAGPLTNPAHYLILVGLYGTLLAGVLTMALARERPSPAAVYLGAGWWAPAGGLLIAACGAFALTGFPLDDLWHRLFGQDVTLWGPTHLMLIGGGSLATLGAMALIVEGSAAVGRDARRESTLVVRVRRTMLAGGFLVALSTFQGEFDFGVPQFRLVFHPTLQMLAAGIGLVAARLYLGRGGALSAVAGFLVIRGFLALMVGGTFGQSLPHFPLYLAEAVAVELVIARASRAGPVGAGALAGLAAGAVGLPAEWAWSHVWMPIPWPASLLAEAVVAGMIAAIAGGAVGGFVGGALSGEAGVTLRRPERLAALAAALVLMAVIGWALPLGADGPRSASLALREVSGAEPGRTVAATIRIRPATAAEEPEFLNVTAWQGGSLVLDPLRRVGPGSYRTTEPIPVHGGWKAVLRLQHGSTLASVPIFMAEDRAIPAAEVPARARFTRAFQADRELLQRERKAGVSDSLTASAYATVLAIALSMAALIAWLLLRLGGSGERSQTAADRVAIGTRSSRGGVEGIC